MNEAELKKFVQALENFASERDGSLAIHFADGDWSVALTWGREAPDSPMAAAQALGSAPLLEDALRQVAEEAHVELPIDGAGMTWEKLLGGESACLIRLGELVFTWAKDAPVIKVVRATPDKPVDQLTDEDLSLTVVLEIEVPPGLDADGFPDFCQEFVGAAVLTPAEAEGLFACYSGGQVDAELLNAVTPKLEAIAGKELVP